jgi:hypothetical protein
MDESLQRSVSRTGFLKLGAAAAVVLGVGPAARAVAGTTTVATEEGATASGGRTVRGPSHLRLATYEPLVGGAFLIRRSPSSALRVKLVSATRLPSDVGEAFSLTFQGHGNAKLDQETYTLEHPRLGTFPLFLVPVGRARRGQSFEAVVNRIPASLMPRV